MLTVEIFDGFAQYFGLPLRAVYAVPAQIRKCIFKVAPPDIRPRRTSYAYSPETEKFKGREK